MGTSTILIVLGASLLAALVAHAIGRKARIPRVTMLLLIGAAFGPVGFDVVPVDLERWFSLLAQISLSMVGFLLGRHFRFDTLERHGRTTLIVAAANSGAAALMVAGVLLVVTRDLTLALLFGALAPATAPAATVDVVREAKAEGPLTRVLLGVVAIDDVGAVVLFSFLVALAQGLSGGGLALDLLLSLGIEICGALVLGVVFGVAMALIAGRLVAPRLLVAEALGFVLLAGGLADHLHFSYLLTCMVLGATVVNLRRHADALFATIEEVADPFLILFFLLAGMSFEVRHLSALALVGGLYVAARTAGKVLGGDLGSRLAGAPATVRRYIGWCTLPQAGVSLGLGLVIAERFPARGPAILSTLVATTVVFELLGPVVTRISLQRAGEIPD